MKIVAYNKCSLLDYPPYLAAVIFTPSCNMNCAYCHNKDLLTCCKYIEEDVIFAHLRHSSLLEAVVISGGEPTLQGQALIDFLQRLRAFSDSPSFSHNTPVKANQKCDSENSNLKIKLDTNGSNPKLLLKILERNLVDYVAMDIKAISEKYSQICGLPFDRVKDSIAILRNFGKYEFRTTAYPAITPEELETLCRTYQADPYFLQQYRRIEENGLLPYDDTLLQHIAEKYHIPLRGV